MEGDEVTVVVFLAGRTVSTKHVQPLALRRISLQQIHIPHTNLACSSVQSVFWCTPNTLDTSLRIPNR